MLAQKVKRLVPAKCPRSVFAQSNDLLLFLESDDNNLNICHGISILVRCDAV